MKQVMKDTEGERGRRREEDNTMSHDMKKREEKHGTWINEKRKKKKKGKGLSEFVKGIKEDTKKWTTVKKKVWNENEERQKKEEKRK